MTRAALLDAVADGMATAGEYARAVREDVVAFTVHGEPVPLARARVVRSKGGKIHAFTPTKSARAKGTISAAAKFCCRTPLEGPIALTVRVFTKNLRRGDLDNYVKLVSDSLQEVAFGDDRQVVEIAATMAVDAKRPRLEIEIRRRA